MTSDPRLVAGMDVFVPTDDFETLEVWNLIGPCQAGGLWVATRNGATASFSEDNIAVTKSEGYLTLAAYHQKQAKASSLLAKWYRAVALGRAPEPKPNS